MSQKFKNIENDEEFKNFKQEDYLPSMNRREPKADTSTSEQEPATEEAAIFPPMDEPDTSSIQAAMSQAIQTGVQDVMETLDTDEEMKDTPTGVEAVSERTVVRRISSMQRRLSLEEYRVTYLQVSKIADRKPVFVSREVRDGLDRIVRCLGGRGMSVSGLVENLARQHLATYGNGINKWRKLWELKTDQLGVFGVFLGMLQITCNEVWRRQVYVSGRLKPIAPLQPLQEKTAGKAHPIGFKKM